MAPPPSDAFALVPLHPAGGRGLVDECKEGIELFGRALGPLEQLGGGGELRGVCHDLMALVGTEVVVAVEGDRRGAAVSALLGIDLLVDEPAAGVSVWLRHAAELAYAATWADGSERSSADEGAALARAVEDLELAARDEAEIAREVEAGLRERDGGGGAGRGGRDGGATDEGACRHYGAAGRGVGADARAAARAGCRDAAAGARVLCVAVDADCAAVRAGACRAAEEAVAGGRRCGGPGAAGGGGGAAKAGAQAAARGADRGARCGGGDRRPRSWRRGPASRS